MVDRAFLRPPGRGFSPGASPPLAPRCGAVDLGLKLQSTLIERAVYMVLRALSRTEGLLMRVYGARSRPATAAKTSTAAAAPALSEAVRPRNGIATSSSHAAATRGRRPRPSAPTTTTAPPDQSTAS